MSTTAARGWRSGAAGGLLLAVLAVGCGAEVPAGEEQPALRQQLAAVDAAVEAGDPAKIRKQVEALVARTAVELANDRISHEQARPVLEAARDILAELPAPEPEPEDATR